MKYSSKLGVGVFSNAVSEEHTDYVFSCMNNLRLNKCTGGQKHEYPKHINKSIRVIGHDGEPAIMDYLEKIQKEMYPSYVDEYHMIRNSTKHNSLVSELVEYNVSAEDVHVLLGGCRFNDASLLLTILLISEDVTICFPELDISMSVSKGDVVFVPAGYIHSYFFDVETNRIVSVMQTPINFTGES